MLDPTGVYDRLLRRLSRRDLMKAGVAARCVGCGAPGRRRGGRAASRRYFNSVPVHARGRLRRSAARRRRPVDASGAAAADRGRHADGAGHRAVGTGVGRRVPDSRAEGGDAGAAGTRRTAFMSRSTACSRRTSTGIDSAPATRSARSDARGRRPRPAPRWTGCASASAAAATTRPATSPRYRRIAQEQFDFVIHTGDYIYEGRADGGKTEGRIRQHQRRRDLSRWSTTATATVSTSRIPISSRRTARRRSSSAGTITRSRTTTPASSTRTARPRRSSCCGVPPPTRRTTSTCRCAWRRGRPARTCASTGACSSAASSISACSTRASGAPIRRATTGSGTVPPRSIRRGPCSAPSRRSGSSAISPTRRARWTVLSQQVYSFARDFVKRAPTRASRWTCGTATRRRASGSIRGSRRPRRPTRSSFPATCTCTTAPI